MLVWPKSRFNRIGLVIHTIMFGAISIFLATNLIECLGETIRCWGTYDASGIGFIAFMFGSILFCSLSMIVVEWVDPCFFWD